MRGGARASCPACLIEGKRRADVETAPVEGGPRFGFTVTKKLGNAVVRNRIRRRLKAAVGAIAGEHARDGFDYVIVARRPAFDRPFEALVADLARALETVHRPQKSASGKSSGMAAKKTAP